MKQLHLTVITGLLAAFVHHAGAALLVYEGYNYTAGSNLSTITPNGSTVGLNTSIAYANNGSTNNYVIGASSLSFGSFATSGGSVTVTNATGVNATTNAQLALSSSYVGTLYSSFLINIDVRNGAGTDGIFNRISNTDGASADRRFATVSDTTTGGSPAGAAYDSTVTNSTVTLALDTTYLMIGRFTNVGSAIAANGAEAKVWAFTLAQYNDVLTNGSFTDSYLDGLAQGSAANQVSMIAIDTTIAAGTYNFATGNRMQMVAVGNTATFDEMRWGGVLSDVVVTVPEPSTYALLGIGIATLLVLRRRARA